MGEGTRGGGIQDTAIRTPPRQNKGENLHTLLLLQLPEVEARVGAAVPSSCIVASVPSSLPPFKTPQPPRRTQKCPTVPPPPVHIQLSRLPVAWYVCSMLTTISLASHTTVSSTVPYYGATRPACPVPRCFTTGEYRTAMLHFWCVPAFIN